MAETFVETTCAYCGTVSLTRLGHYNRSIKDGRKFYCNRTCTGLGRRLNETVYQCKAKKAAYDRHYATIDVEKKQKKRHEYFKRTYDPVKAALIRKGRMHLHVKYCQQPEYREWKQKYDKVYHAKKKWGEYFEAAILLDELEGHIDRYAASIEGNTFNKSQQRKIKWKNLQRST